MAAEAIWGGGVVPAPGDDLDKCFGSVETIGAAGVVGYFLTRISGGFGVRLFDRESVSGWGSGVGVIGTVMPGMWIRLG